MALVLEVGRSDGEVGSSHPGHRMVEEGHDRRLEMDVDHHLPQEGDSSRRGGDPAKRSAR